MTGVPPATTDVRGPYNSYSNAEKLVIMLAALESSVPQAAEQCLKAHR